LRTRRTIPGRATSSRAVAAALGSAVTIALLASCSLIPLGGGSGPSEPSSTASSAPDSTGLPSDAPAPSSSSSSSSSGSAAPFPATDGATIVTLTPDEAKPLDEYRMSTPYESFQVGYGLPNGFPAGLPAYKDMWIKASMVGFINGDDRESYTLMFVGSYADLDALLPEFEEQGFALVSDNRDDTKRAIIVESAAHRVIITATESSVSSGEPQDPSYTYTIVVK
jgi:hypothetical protein